MTSRYARASHFASMLGCGILHAAPPTISANGRMFIMSVRGPIADIRESPARIERPSDNSLSEICSDGLIRRLQRRGLPAAQYRQSAGKQARNRAVQQEVSSDSAKNPLTKSRATISAGDN